MAEQITTAVSRRAVVFSSGSEVKEGKIKDTNSPFIMAALKEAGYLAQFGGVLDDDEVATAASLEEAVERGFGLIISTGGVGAENKDFTVEAIRRLDPRAHTPYILKFTPDNHRHYKEGVRIAVGKVGLALLVALPGPHEEAKIGCIRLLTGLRQGMEGFALAEYIVAILRDRWQQAIHK
jgi:molybdenum cofactor synthesis domain-containing protein